MTITSPTSPLPASTPRRFLPQFRHTGNNSPCPSNWLGAQLSEDMSPTRNDGNDTTPVHSQDYSRRPLHLSTSIDTQKDNLQLIAMQYNDCSEVSSPINDEYSSQSTLSLALESEWSPLSSFTCSPSVLLYNRNNVQNFYFLLLY